MPVKTRAQRARERSQGEGSLTPSDMDWTPRRRRRNETPQRIRLEHQSLRTPMEFVVPPPVVEHPIDIRQKIRTMVFDEEDDTMPPLLTPPAMVTPTPPASTLSTPEAKTPAPPIQTLTRKEKWLLGFVIVVVLAVAMAMKKDVISQFATDTIWPKCYAGLQWCADMIAAASTFLLGAFLTFCQWLVNILSAMWAFICNIPTYMKQAWLELRSSNDTSSSNDTILDNETIPVEQPVQL